MDDPNRKPPPCGTQIDDIPSCLIIDILSRLPIKSLVISSLVCKSWFILFSDPLFVELHRARSPTYLFRRKSRWESKLRCIFLEREIPGEKFKFGKIVSLPDSEFTCVNSCNGLLCLDEFKSGGDDVYVCNPVLGEYITIPIGNTSSDYIRRTVLGFCSRSNQFKVLQISGSARIAKIYTIGNGTRRWRMIGMAPSCTGFGCGPVNSFVNGSIHWIDRETPDILYFNFQSEKFGSLSSPPFWRRSCKFQRRLRVGVEHGCLCIYPDGLPGRDEIQDVWIMKEYGVKESWTKISATALREGRTIEFKSLLCSSEYRLTELGTDDTIYNPSFISLEDVAKGEQLTVMSRTRIGRDIRICDQLSNIGYDNAHPGGGVLNPLIHGSELFPCRALPRAAI